MALRIRDFRFQSCNARWLLYLPNAVTFEHAEFCSRLVSFKSHRERNMLLYRRTIINRMVFVMETYYAFFEIGTGFLSVSTKFGFQRFNFITRSNHMPRAGALNLSVASGDIESEESSFATFPLSKPSSTPQQFWKLKSCLLARGGVVVKALCSIRQVAGSIPDGVIGIFKWHNPSGRIMALGSTQPLTEMSTRCISWGVKAAGA